MKRRETGLLVFAAAIVAASLLTETRRDGIAAAPAAREITPPGAAARGRAEVATLDVDEWLKRLKARDMSTEPSGPGLFGGTNWNPPPQAPAASQPAEAPTPPFPFRLLGRMTLGGATVVVLSKGDQTYPVKAGEVIEQHRIDRIDEDGLRVTYAPNGAARTYRYEELYPALTAAASVPFAQPNPQPGLSAQSAEPLAMPIQQQAQGSPAPREASPKVPVGAGAAATPDPAASNSPLSPINPVAGADAPIGGMVISPTPPGAGMVITPTPPGAGMIMTPTPPGAMMQMTPGTTSGPTPTPPAK